ncbi:MAG: hypothetical protein RBS38_00735 [Bacteroidales bacterium]|nr:hypothetical protein [Bacteroidales bacterium]
MFYSKIRMKPENEDIKSFQLIRRFFCFQVFLLIFLPSYPQGKFIADSAISKAERLPMPDIRKIRLLLPGTDNAGASRLIAPAVNGEQRTMILLDSLKNKASKTLVTRKLYDFIIIDRDPETTKEISGSSEEKFIKSSGLIIRNIEIKRLNVFGSNINTPDFFEPNRTEKLLNKTHFNTNELIIKKNLLFHSGDTISPLTMSDNERYLRQLPFIDDARILVVPVSDSLADVIVVTKDIYSLGVSASLAGVGKGKVSVFERNVFGMGHEFGIDVPWDVDSINSPGFGVNYKVNNLGRTFTDLGLFFHDGLGRKTYGIDIGRRLISSTTKYAGNITLRRTITSDDLDSLPEPHPVKYNLQDYWLLRSFLIDNKSVTRLIVGVRYTNNNVFQHPYINPDSYHHLQQYRLFLGSVSYSVQRFYKASLIYGYGRTEDIPHGLLFNITAGREFNKFKNRYYTGASVSLGESVNEMGYIYSSAAFGTFINHNKTEQGILSFRTSFISNLLYTGRYRIRNFINAEYTRGFDRYYDESLTFIRDDGFSGFRNDSIGNTQRLAFNFETVLFSPVDFYGFRFALFGFADAGILFGTNQFVARGEFVSAFGLGLRVRNDNLILNTFQIRLGFFPNVPPYSVTTPLMVSGEQMLKPYNFEPGQPSIVRFR